MKKKQIVHDKSVDSFMRFFELLRLWQIKFLQKRLKLDYHIFKNLYMKRVSES